MKFKLYANENFEIMILFQNFGENKSIFSRLVSISESYFGFENSDKSSIVSIMSSLSIQVKNL